MKRIIQIEGMSCGHCSAKAEKALNKVVGVKAKVNLAKKQATVNADESIKDETLKSAVEDAGYSVVSISIKKGFLG